MCIIASTNRNLEEKIKDHSFREDLFSRLNVVTLQTPTLAEIREDITLLVDHFARQVCCELDLPEKRFSLEAVEELMQRSWPGNVRELQNVVRGAVLFCPDDTIDTRYLRSPEGSSRQPAVRQGETVGTAVEPYKDAKERAINDFTRSYITRLLETTGGNVSRAAEASRLTKAALQKIMRRYDIASKEFRSE